jgi:Trypsin-like serine proteases, typically periplasmic, contain C-terminal PDZ domain
MDKDEEQFDFIREKIKDRPISKRRILLKIVGTIVLGILFGIMACFSFVLLKPWIEAEFLPEKEIARVIVPRDEETETQEMESLKASQETQQIEETEESELEPEMVIIKETVGLEVSDYKKLYDKLYVEVVAKARTSLVSVTGMTQDTSWFAEIYENQTKEATGFIVADNGEELFVLTEYNVVKDVSRIKITFIDGTSVDATFQQYDTNTGLAIVKFAKISASESVLEYITVDALSNTAVSRIGESVIALGAYTTHGSSLGYGVVTNTSTSYKNTNSVSGSVARTFDLEYSLINTDIVVASGGNGILVNLEGKVVGIIVRKFNGNSGLTMLTAVNVSQLKDLIQKLSNGEAPAYLGIRGTEVSKDLMEQEGVPRGLYVGAVEMDSPAMRKGILSGDIIVEINGMEIKSQTDYRNFITSHYPGDEIVITVARKGMGSYVEIVYEDVVLERTP